MYGFKESNTHGSRRSNVVGKEKKIYVCLDCNMTTTTATRYRYAKGLEQIRADAITIPLPYEWFYSSDAGISANTNETTLQGNDVQMVRKSVKRKSFSYANMLMYPSPCPKLEPFPNLGKARSVFWWVIRFRTKRYKINCLFFPNWLLEDPMLNRTCCGNEYNSHHTIYRVH